MTDTVDEKIREMARDVEKQIREERENGNVEVAKHLEEYAERLRNNAESVENVE